MVIPEQTSQTYFNVITHPIATSLKLLIYKKHILSLVSTTDSPGWASGQSPMPTPANSRASVSLVVIDKVYIYVIMVDLTLKKICFASCIAMCYAQQY